ncbi:Variant surface glycoprotein [Trypanosoma congolense IL3000]|uniref:Variant surface glycoprotein n=1 Tax=Trypanosoma congolense (strain IL3000) TaxID=1068625 RepID=F9W4C5_TRYCI|nr:Variant surface glycoprotein [Trypanosoma congolense IL3000]
MSPATVKKVLFFTKLCLLKEIVLKSSSYKEVKMRMKVLLLMLTVGGQYLEACAARIDVYKHLCEITRNVVALLGLHRNRSALRDAIYGKKGRAIFDEEGIVTVQEHCGGVPSGRAILCNHFKGDLPGNAQDGCLAESLLGTFMCVCAPGGREAKMLCGMEPWKADGTWWGGFLAKQNREKLFRDVWRKLIGKCLVESEIHTSTEINLKSLETSLKAIRESLRSSASGGTNYFYLGEPEVTSCSGGVNSGEGICASYRGGLLETKHSVKIPWLSEIEKTTNELLGKITEPSSESHGQVDPSFSEKKANIPIPAAANEAPEENEALKPVNIAAKGNIQLKNIQPEPQVNESMQITNLAKPEEKRKPTKYNVVDIPHLAIDPNEDFSILTNQKWLLLSILFN